MTKSWFNGVFAVLVLMAACQFPLSSTNGTSVRLTLTVSQPSLVSSGARLLLTNAVSIAVTVESEGDLVEKRTVSRTGSQVSIDLSLAPLKVYTVKAEAKDQAGTVLFAGQATVTLTGPGKLTLNLLPLAAPAGLLEASAQTKGGSLGTLTSLAPGAMATYRLDFGATGSQFTFAPLPPGVELHFQNADGSALPPGNLLKKANLKAGTAALATYHNAGTAASAALTSLGSFTIPVAALTVAGPTDLGWGETGDLTLTVTPANADRQNPSDFTFTSLDPAVVAVDAAGHLTAQAKDGETTILVQWKDDPTGVKATHLVRSSQVALTSLAFTQGSAADVATGTALALTVVPTPLNATQSTVQWSSSDSTLASVDANGLVTALLPGVVTVTATSKAFATVSTAITLTLTPTKFTLASFPSASVPNAPNQTAAVAGVGDQLWALTSDQSVRTLSAGLWEKNPSLPPAPAGAKWLAATVDGTLFAGSPTAVSSFDGTGTWTLVTAPPAGATGLAAEGGVLWSSASGFLWSWQGGVWHKGPALPAGLLALGGGEDLVALTTTQTFTFNGSTWDAGPMPPAQAVSLTSALQSTLILVVR